MPVLGNVRHEKFSRALADGNTQVKAYAIAGFVPEEGGNTSNASALANKPYIKERVQELLDERDLQMKGQYKIHPDARSIDEAGMSELWVIQNLMKNVYLCQASGDMKTANATIEIVNRYLGYFNSSPGEGEKGTHKKLEKGPGSLNILIAAAAEVDGVAIMEKAAKDVTPKNPPGRPKKTYDA